MSDSHAINHWTDLSIQLANQRDYLDQLYRVYPLAPEVIREVDKHKWAAVESAFNAKDNQELILSLLSLELFPIKDSYVPYLRADKSAIKRNPETVNRLAGRLYDMGLDQIWARASEPKETNRQIGPLFRRWVTGGVLGVPELDEAGFLAAKNNAILAGSDAALKSFAARYLNYKSTKGLDLVAKFNNKYVVAEAKFLTDRGGHQNEQFDDAINLVNNTEVEAITVAILDGVVYIPNRSRQFETIVSADANVLSSLLLREFLYQV